MCSNPEITQAMLAEKLSVSYSSLQREIAELKVKERIGHNGGKRCGSWVIHNIEDTNLITPKCQIGALNGVLADKILEELCLNPNTARVFYRTGNIKRWGQGLQQICDICKSPNENRPEFIVHGEDIT